MKEDYVFVMSCDRIQSELDWNQGEWKFSAWFYSFSPSSSIFTAKFGKIQIFKMFSPNLVKPATPSYAGTNGRETRQICHFLFFHLNVLQEMSSVNLMSGPRSVIKEYLIIISQFGPATHLDCLLLLTLIRRRSL